MGRQPDPRTIGQIVCHGGNTHGHHVPGMTLEKRKVSAATSSTRCSGSFLSTKHGPPQCLQDCPQWATCTGPNNNEGEFRRKIKKWESNDEGGAMWESNDVVSNKSCKCPCGMLCGADSRKAKADWIYFLGPDPAQVNWALIQQRFTPKPVLIIYYQQRFIIGTVVERYQQQFYLRTVVDNCFL
jgi:hypothetical protein